MIKKIIIVFLALFLVCACNDTKDKVKSNNVKEIKSGNLDGYYFEETDEITDRIKIQMNDGGIMLVVLSNKNTPITINNFKKLVSEHFYDGIIFHRVIKDFMIQAGDPTGTGNGGSGQSIKGEFKSNGVENNLSHTRGVISMARTNNDYNSASSQFFIVHKDSTYLDGDYASFGKVFAGFKTLDKIAQVKTKKDRPVSDQIIKSIRFINVKTTEE